MTEKLTYITIRTMVGAMQIENDEQIFNAEQMAQQQKGRHDAYQNVMDALDRLIEIEESKMKCTPMVCNQCHKPVSTDNMDAYMMGLCPECYKEGIEIIRTKLTGKRSDSE